MKRSFEPLERNEDKNLPPELLFRILANMFGEDIARKKMKELLGVKIGDIVEDESEKE